MKGAPVSAVADMWFREGPVASFPRFTDQSVVPGNSREFQATLIGLAGRQVVIETSSDALAWTPLRTNLFTNSTLPFTYSNAVGPSRFYRAFYPIP